MLIAFPYPTISFLPVYYGVEKGYFAREGLSVNYIHIREPMERDVKLMLDGDIAFISSLNTVIKSAILGLGELRALCGGISRSALLMVRPEIQKFDDLKGKRVMVGGGASSFQMTYRLKKKGWVKGKDIEIVPGDDKSRITAFQDPSIAGVGARVQFLYWAVKAGFHPLDSEDDVVSEGGGLTTSLRLIKENPDAVQKVVNAFVASIEAVKRDRDGAINVARKVIPNLSQEEIEGNYDLIKDYFQTAISPQTVENLGRMHASITGKKRWPKYEEVVDLSFLQKAEAENENTRCR